MGDWQPIETAPKDERVLLFFPAFGAWIATWWPGSWSWAREEWVIHSPFSRGDRAVFGHDAPQPTHWKPIPPPPVSGETDPVLSLVAQQALDEGLWFQAQTASEAYLQQELRRLHAAIEGSGESA